jgi:hypothetical protein
MAALAETDDADGSRFYYSTAPSYLEFVAYFVVENWVSAPSPAADAAIMRVLTSGNDRAVNVIGWMAFRNRAALGRRWWRFQHLALLWSGLSILAPRTSDNATSKSRWLRWRQWLRTRSLSVSATNSGAIDPLAIAKRVERIEILRWEERYAQDGRKFTVPNEHKIPTTATITATITV